MATIIDQSGLGTYAHDVISGESLRTDDIHNGNMGFHQPQTMHDEGFGYTDESTGVRRADIINPFAEQGEEINIKEEEVAFSALQHVRNGADEWMTNGGNKW